MKNSSFDRQGVWSSWPLTVRSAGHGLCEVNGVQGYLLPGDIELLMSKALALPDQGVIVEIGSFLGLSAIVMANALIRANNVQASIYCVDTWEGSDEHRELELVQRGELYSRFCENVRNAGVEDLIRPMQMRSAQAASELPNGMIDLLFVDGDHSLPGAYADLEVWYPKTRPGATIIGHDCVPGGEVHQAVRKWVKEHRRKAVVHGPPCHYIFEIE